MEENLTYSHKVVIYNQTYNLRSQHEPEYINELAAHVNLRRYKKHPRGPKKKPTQRTAYKNGGHVSTAKILTKKI